MMNPDILLDLARERRRDLLSDAARSRRRMLTEVEPLSAREALIVGRPARTIDAHVRAEARFGRRASAASELPAAAR